MTVDNRRYMLLKMKSQENYFSIFGLPVSFVIDQATLTDRYRSLQRQLHPDNFASRSASERATSVQQASLINDAYNILKNALLRAKYLLELKGEVLNDELNTVMEPVFLMRQMELREAMEAVSNADDPLIELDSLSDQIKKDTKSLVANISQLFGSETPDLKKIAAEVRKLQFFVRLQQEIDGMYAKFEN